MQNLYNYNATHPR